ncbi:biogenesis of lysosome-related organelles complex 1 subunit 3 isoform X5 [Takifugu rubripes]|uniref:biogenesis of lysosome-related organelles complex 1 subunit 3 isoform X5 n=1 Tax=Takifugu rubripes TaxID=31033 RepID=UPI0011453C0D|nr:biogenesis of lysosome-related organelles complex 1 subunit 3 isoform X5 [Takifugu rubripes]XP_056905831.1 biogenesis of lysosome-related organelles complex 1 subunit 3 isoform X4 [Takifugu flavidus]
MESSYFRISHVIIVFLPHRAMSNRYKTVVQGEASETDSDDEVYITSMPPPQAALVGLKVSGEASETDSDGDEEQLDQTSTSSQQSSLILQRDLPPLIVVQDRPDIQSVVEDRPSPTHRPHGEMVRQLYSSASKELQEVGHCRTLKWYLNDALLVLNEHLTCKHLPFCILGKWLY